MSICQDCNAQVVWASTGGDKAIQLDLAPHPDGTVRLTRQQQAPPLATDVPLLDRAAMRGRLHRPHSQTCEPKEPR